MVSIKKSKLNKKSKNVKKPYKKNQNKNCLQRNKLLRNSNKRKIKRSIASPLKLNTKLKKNNIYNS